MPELLKTPSTLFLPDIEDIEDEKIKRIFEEYNKALEEFVIAAHSDVTRLHERLVDEEAWTKSCLKSRDDVASAGTLDLALFRVDGGSNFGILMVGSFRKANANYYTETIYAFMSRGTGYTATSIGTKNGTSGAMAFTLTMPSNGVVRITNDDANTANITIQFIGTEGF